MFFCSLWCWIDSIGRVLWGEFIEMFLGNQSNLNAVLTIMYLLHDYSRRVLKFAMMRIIDTYRIVAEESGFSLGSRLRYTHYTRTR